MTNDIHLGSLYVLMAVMLVAGSLIAAAVIALRVASAMVAAVLVASIAVVAPGLVAPAAIAASAIAVRLDLARLVTILAWLVVLLAFGHFLLRLAQHSRVMFGMLQKGLLGHAITRQLRIAGQGQVFFDDLLGRATHLAFGARAVEDAVDDVAQRAALAVRLVARTGFR